MNYTRKILYDETGWLDLHEPKHTPRVFYTPQVRTVEARFWQYIEPTLHHQFRSRHGIHFLNLVSFYAHMKGTVPHEMCYRMRRRGASFLSRFDYIKISPRDSVVNRVEYGAISWLRPAFFCINDNGSTTDMDRVRMQRFLHRYYPVPAPWEREETDKE
ncbi:hypothetical protein CALK_1828 [Chitinivibrio alkaliphilus ACht1]|uniref:Stealth protein CR4 conserved region 4 domain-containing protein n=1 Tax=Chitinivibrio alkaliphilus ACht1 TaxID=1313304 RepID=U7D5Y3_9BACT|nr:hypothetical protein CALK_1828 [Chitinivibrio alkaliphilus ACht1]